MENCDKFSLENSMNQIQSIHNKLIKTIATLQSKKGRVEQNQFIAEGIRTCQTLLESPLQFINLYTTEKMISEAKKIVDEKYMIVVSDAIMKKLSPSTTPSGVLGAFSIPVTKISSTLRPGLVLAHITDPGNMGTLIRSAIAFGFTQIIIIEGCDPWSPKVVQATAGTIGFANIIQTSWEDLKNHTHRPPLTALVPTGGTIVNKAQKNTLLIVGNEAHGIPTPWLKECDYLITLPMPGKIESLNAAIAGSIALYLSISQ